MPRRRCASVRQRILETAHRSIDQSIHPQSATRDCGTLSAGSLVASGARRAVHVVADPLAVGRRTSTRACSASTGLGSASTAAPSCESRSSEMALAVRVGAGGRSRAASTCTAATKRSASPTTAARSRASSAKASRKTCDETSLSPASCVSWCGPSGRRSTGEEEAEWGEESEWGEEAEWGDVVGRQRGGESGRGGTLRDACVIGSATLCRRYRTSRQPRAENREQREKGERDRSENAEERESERAGREQDASPAQKHESPSSRAGREGERETRMGRRRDETRRSEEEKTRRRRQDDTTRRRE